ncbi:uncharacterized protein G2W53_020857 [Senna tora]|uniref:RING-type E3 ubiquitin transferase n=1 Tax=Senna tora TaxID=362788 RepID=A0A834TIH2_9FABA|nr:uncharacterized protein G2W53_020857 [Senna tora]
MAVLHLLHSISFFLLLTCFLYSSASLIPYTNHCGSIVPESNPRALEDKVFPLGRLQRAYFTGGDKILGLDSYGLKNQNSFLLRTRNLRQTDVAGLFKLSGYMFIRSNTPFYYGGNRTYGGVSSYYRPHRSYGRASVSINLDGFWSESTGKLCMVGSGIVYSKGGNSNNLNVDTVLKLNNVFNSSNISTVVSGSLESLSSENEESYFKPVSVLMLPRLNYEFTLDSKEARNEFSLVGSDGDDADKGLSQKMSSFCSYSFSKKLRLEYSSDCNSPQNCTPFDAISGYLPHFISLNVIDCTFTMNDQMRVLIKFDNYSYVDSYNQGFNPKMMIVGEGWWNEKKNRLNVVACHFLGLASSSFSGAHVGDCSVRLRLRFPSIWSIKDTSSIVGQIWSNKTVNSSGYFKGITFRDEDDRKEGFPSFNYNYKYTQLDRVKNLCPRKKITMNKGQRYPNPFSYDMRFDMSVRDTYRKVAWGYSAPLFVGDLVYYMRFSNFSGASSPSSSIAIPAEKFSSNDLFNMSYKIIISMLPSSTLRDSNSLFNTSYEAVKISAEGVYDAGTGILCMVGCRNLPSSNNGIPMAHSVDCEIQVKFQFPPLHKSRFGYIEGSIESTRKKSDPLYFKRLGLISAAYTEESAKKTIQREDMEIIMVLIFTTLACVFVGFQLYHVKKNSKVLPFISLIMLSFLTLNHMIPLVLNFEALFTKNHNTKSIVLSDAAWLESNEITVRLLNMVAFLLYFRLLQLTWSARKSTDGTRKSLWDSEKEAVFVTSPLYAIGFLVVMMVKSKKVNNEPWVPVSSRYQHASSSWEVLKSYGGLVLDGFLLPQIVMNMFSNMRENALSFPFYFGTSFVRLVPHAYDLYRTSSYVRQYSGSYLYADPSADLYSTGWDIVIPLGGLLFSVIIYLQQSFGGSCILPRRFRGSNSVVYEKVPVAKAVEDGENKKEPSLLCNFISFSHCSPSNDSKLNSNDVGTLCTTSIECMKTTVHIINRLPQANLGFVSSYEKLWQVKPTVSHFRVFGCVCYAFVPDHLRSKFDKKAVRCIFVGYDNERKGWRCCDPTTGRCYVSKNVVFDEASSWWSPQITVLLDSKEIEEKLQEKASDGEDDERQKSSPVNAGDNHTREKSPWKTGVHVTAEDARPSQFEEPEEIRGETHPPQQELRRSTRQRKPNPKYTNIALVEDGRSNELARKHQRTKNGRTTKR